MIFENKMYDQLFKHFQFENNKSVIVTFTARVSQFISINTIFNNLTKMDNKNDNINIKTLV